MRLHFSLAIFLLCFILRSSPAQSLGPAGSMAIKPIRFVSGGLAEPKLAESKLLPPVTAPGASSAAGPWPAPAVPGAGSSASAATDSASSPATVDDSSNNNADSGDPMNNPVLASFLKREQAHLAARAAAAAAAPRVIKHDPTLGRFERYTKGFGMKILRMYGFRGALGKTEQGVTGHVNVVVRPKNAGLGYVTEAKNEELDADSREAAAGSQDKKKGGGDGDGKSAFERQLDALWRADSTNSNSNSVSGGKAGKGKGGVRTVAEIVADRERAKSAAGGAGAGAVDEIMLQGNDLLFSGAGAGSGAGTGAGVSLATLASLMSSSSSSLSSAANTATDSADTGIADTARELAALSIGVAPAAPLTPAAAAAEGARWAAAFRRRLRLTVDLAEDDVVTAERKREREEKALARMQQRQAELEAEAEAEAEAAARLDCVIAVVTKLNSKLAAITSKNSVSSADAGVSSQSLNPSPSQSGEVAGPAAAVLAQLQEVRLALDTLVFDYPRDFVHLKLAALVTAVAKPLWVSLFDAWHPYHNINKNSTSNKDRKHNGDDFLLHASGQSAYRDVGFISTPALCDEIALWRATLTATHRDVALKTSKAPQGALLASFRALAKEDVYGALLRSTLVPRLATIAALWEPAVVAHSHAVALALCALRPLCGEVLFESEVVEGVIVPRLVESWTDGAALAGVRPDGPMSTECYNAASKQQGAVIDLTTSDSRAQAQSQSKSPPQPQAQSQHCDWAQGYPQQWTFAFLLPLPTPTREQLLHCCMPLTGSSLSSKTASASASAGSKLRPPLVPRSAVAPLAAAVRETLGRWLQRWPTAVSAPAAVNSTVTVSVSVSAANDATVVPVVAAHLARLAAPAALEAIAPWVTGLPLHALLLQSQAASSSPQPQSGPSAGAGGSGLLNSSTVSSPVVGVSPRAPAGESASWPRSEAAKFVTRAVLPRLAAATRAGVTVRGCDDFNAVSLNSNASTNKVNINASFNEVLVAAPESAAAVASLLCMWSLVLSPETVSKSVLVPHVFPQLFAALYHGLSTLQQQQLHGGDAVSSAVAAAAAAARRAAQWLCAWRQSLPRAVAESASAKPLWTAAARLLETLTAAALAAHGGSAAAATAAAAAATDAVLGAILALEAAAQTHTAASTAAAAGAGLYSGGAGRTPPSVGLGVGANLGDRPLLLREVLELLAASEGLVYAPDRQRRVAKDGKPVFMFGEHVPVVVDNEVAWTRAASGEWEAVTLQELLNRAKRFTAVA